MVIIYRYFSTLALVLMALAAQAQAYVAKVLEIFREFPPREKPASFSIDQVMEKLQTSGGSK